MPSPRAFPCGTGSGSSPRSPSSRRTPGRAWPPRTPWRSLISSKTAPTRMVLRPTPSPRSRTTRTASSQISRPPASSSLSSGRSRSGRASRAGSTPAGWRWWPAAPRDQQQQGVQSHRERFPEAAESWWELQPRRRLLQHLQQRLRRALHQAHHPRVAAPRAPHHQLHLPPLSSTTSARPG